MNYCDNDYNGGNTNQGIPICTPCRKDCNILKITSNYDILQFMNWCISMKYTHFKVLQLVS